MTRERRPSGGYALALILTTGVGALLIGALLYATPADFVGAWGMAPENAQRFKAAFPAAAGLPVLSKPTFTWLFRGLLIATWTAWIGVIVAMFRGATLGWRALVPIVSGVAVLLAFFSPPVLSRDVYAYVAYGRVFMLGVNPYLIARTALEAVADPAAAFLVWNKPLGGYGPLWALMAGGVAAIGHAATVHAVVISHKLIAALSLIAVAFGAARLAGRREPGRAPLAFVAVGLNPLCLMEGPGSGHNDFLMMAALVWAAVLTADRRWRASALCVGLAIAVKPVAPLAVPLLVMECWTRGAASTRWRDCAWVLGLSLLPVIVLSLFFGGPYLLARSLFPESATTRMSANQSTLLAVAMLGALVGAVLWVRRLASQQVIAAWLTAWIPASLALVLLTARVLFPWYFVWPLMASLCGWDERHRILTTAICVLAILATAAYTLHG